MGLLYIYKEVIPGMTVIFIKRKTRDGDREWRERGRAREREGRGEREGGRGRERESEGEREGDRGETEGGRE